jgi:hypothetical protein
VNKLIAQTIPVDDIREEQFRLMQLLSDSTTQTSFSNRPIHFDTYQELFENNLSEIDSWWAKPLTHLDTTFVGPQYPVKMGIYEPVMRNTYNSKLPYSENNGAAWYGRGHNTEIHGGFYLTSGPVTFTFRPHVIHTQNKEFEIPRFIPIYRRGDEPGSPRYVAEGYLPEDTLAERIDRPFRFGPDS